MIYLILHRRFSLLRLVAFFGRHFLSSILYRVYELWEIWIPMGQNEKIKHRKKITKRVSTSFPTPIIAACYCFVDAFAAGVT